MSDDINNNTNTNILISPIIDNAIDCFISEVKKKHNKDKIMKNIVEPIVEDINKRYYPHMITLTVLLVFIIVLLALLVGTNLKDKNKSS